LCGILDEETASNRGVRVEADFEFVEEREEILFDVSGDGVVITLEDGREDRPCGRLKVVDLLDIGGFEV
jgi:hypothetical protein